MFPVAFEAKPIDAELFGFGNVEDAEDRDGLFAEHFFELAFYGT